MLDKFIEGAILGLLAVGVPLSFTVGKRKREEAIQNGKIYYGLLGFRVLILFVLGFISAEMLLMIILGDSVEGSFALLLVFLSSLPITALYIVLYKKAFKKKLQKLHQIEDCSPTATLQNQPPSTEANPIPSASANPTTSKAVKKYCSRCGKEINPKTKKCTGCGKQYFKGIPWKTIAWIIVGLLCTASFALNVYFITKLLLMRQGL